MNIHFLTEKPQKGNKNINTSSSNLSNSDRYTVNKEELLIMVLFIW